MKNLKTIICWILIILSLGTLCACGDTNNKRSPEQQVSDIVFTKSVGEFRWSTIGGNELRSSSATITNVKKVSDSEYLVSGKMVMTDIYGTKWNNTFDCTVLYDFDDDEWSAGQFEYTSSTWRRG